MALSPPGVGLEVSVARMLACFDPRLEVDDVARVLGVSPSTVRKAIRRLRLLRTRLWPLHIRDVRFLGLGAAVVHSSRPMPPIHSIHDIERSGIPMPRFLHSYRVTLDGLHIYSYVVPGNLSSEVLAEIEELGDVDYGFTIPVIPCYRGGPGSTIGYTSNPGIRRRLLAMLIYARLDLDPLASLQELANVTPVLRERLGKVGASYRLDVGKMLKVYRRLSGQGLVGRVLALPIVTGSSRPIPTYIVVRRECLGQLYDVLVETWSTANIFVGGEWAAAAMLLPDEHSERLRRQLQDCIVYSGVITEGFGTTIPLEMYDVSRGEWSLEPQPLERHVQPYLAPEQA